MNFQNMDEQEIITDAQQEHYSQQSQRQINQNEVVEQAQNIVQIDPEDVYLNEIRNRITDTQRRNQNNRVNQFNWGAFCQSFCRREDPKQAKAGRCIDLIFFIYVVYLYYSSALTNTTFVGIWILTYCCAGFVSGIKVCSNVAMLLWAAYIYFFGEASSEITLFFYLHIFDFCIISCGLICCQLGIILVCCLYVWASVISAKAKVKKYLRYRNNLNTIKNICAPIINNTSQQKLECSICLIEGREFCQTSCKHRFHQKCLQTWLKANISCPLCRRKLY